MFFILFKLIVVGKMYVSCVPGADRRDVLFMSVWR